MKTKTMWSAKPAPAHGKALAAVMACSVVCAFAGLALTPAHAEGNDKRDEQHAKDKDKNRDEGHGDRERRGHEEARFYPRAVYAPPAIYYPPQQSPGISIFLPLDIRVR